MAYQKCSKCGTQFNKKLITKSVWLSGYKEIKCGNDNCGAKYKPTKATRLLIGAGIALPILFFSSVYAYTGLYILLAYVLWMLLFVCITPYVAMFEEETGDGSQK